MSKLVIVESPAKAHTVGRILGPGYKVMASVGHVRDLPEHQEGIKREELPGGALRFTPGYVVPPDKEKVVSALASAARQADEIFLASDPDREGEAIAWHLREELGRRLGAKCPPFRRVEYHEITPRAVQAAIANPHDIDQARVDAQQARRCIDRYLGFRISPKVARAVRGGSSAGRVQSVALRLVRDREREVRAFVPQPYWEFAVKLAKRGPGAGEPFAMRLRKLDGRKAEIRDEGAAKRAEAFLGAAAYAVRSVEPRQAQKRPGPPFTTSTLQQAASNALGFSPDRTMRLAQDLYEAGLITYMRTDSTNIAPEAREAAAAYVAGAFGGEFADPHNYATRSKGAQEAHECIRPTDPAATPERAAMPDGRDAEGLARLYRLVWERFVSSQMAPAVSEVTTATVDATAAPGLLPAGSPAAAELTASVSRLVFPGFLALRGAEGVAKAESADAAKDGEETSDALAALPPLAPGEALDPAAVLPERKETKPPPRFNEASLVREMEARGIGRPSTYASTVKTLKDRKYVASERRVLSPTELGANVCDWLVAHYPDMMDVGYTAEMERKLDDAQDPATASDWQALLGAFWRELEEWNRRAKDWADPAAVATLLEAFRDVRDWEPPHKAGARTYDDRKFVQDIAYDVMGEARPRAKDRRPDAPFRFERPASFPAECCTEPQFHALARTLLRYRDQAPGAEGAIRAAGLGGLLDQAASPAADERTAALLDVLARYGAAPDDERFASSLAEQVRRGRPLSAKQTGWLPKLFLNARDRVPAAEFEALCAKFGIEPKAEESVDPERAAAVVAALAGVTEWAAPAAPRKGGRVYDDKKFYADVAAQFGARRTMSAKQLGALERMLLRYRAQIPGADELAARYGIEARPRRARGGRAAKAPPAGVAAASPSV